MRIATTAFGLLLACIMPGAAHALTGTPLATCVQRAGPGQTPRALFDHPAGFDCVRAQTSYGAGDFWVLSAPLSAPAPANPVVRTASVWQDRVTLHILYADGAIAHAGFTSATTAPHLRLGAIFELALPHRPAPPVRLLWQVHGSTNVRGVVIGARLADRDLGARAEIVSAALYAAFAGIAFGLLIYNLALWGALRQRFQPAYCLMLACLLGYAFSSSGAIGQVTGIDNNDRLRINAVLLASSTATALLFARAFFERRVFSGWLRHASTAVMIVLVSMGIFAAIVSPWQSWLIDRALTASHLLAVALVPAVLWRAWMRRSRYLGMFALAWGVPISFALLRIAAAVELVPWSFWTDNSTLLSMACEACFSSIAIAYRMRLLSLERDEAREQEVAARLLADTDPLTALLNRRAFLAQAIGRVHDQTLVIVDIDHFKRVNETIGHDGGDEVLRVIARTLRQAVPADTLVARIGGEEFAILVPAPAGTIATDLLDRLRSARMPFDLTVTASIGTCTGPIHREVDWKALYRMADRALFAAKAAGRDRARDAGALAQAA